ncbi:MAG: ATP-dependent zinc metalloprotease FtsH [Mycoplasmatales bacterium]
MKKKNNNPIIRVLIILIFSLAIFSVVTYFTGTEFSSINFTYNEFVTKLENGEIETVNITPNHGVYEVNGYIKATENEKKKTYNTNIPQTDGNLTSIEVVANKNAIPVTLQPERQPSQFTSFFLSIILFGGMFFLLTKMLGGKGGPMSAGENKARLNVSSDKLFSDVIGYEEEKQELVEIIDFLKNPTLYHEMGANIPNGVLLEGPPGTGKTLMAKAVAGEASVPFYSISGSDFVEMFVGVGASRVRNLFKDAKKNGPCIIFIDEIDAIGTRDNGGPGGRNTEQEQTINALLVELDGFATDAGKGQVIIIGATNRADKLDKALLRPGRFDRKVMMGLPELKAREDILIYHAKKRKINEDVSFKDLARSTSGMSGAQLEAVVNEAAILAVRHKNKTISQELINEAVDRVLMGPAKISNKYSVNDKKIVSYHESGHAITGLELKDGMQVQKITIIPRRNAGGYVAYAPKEEEERFTTKSQLEAQLISLMAGRASEEIFIGDITVGAHNDFEQATNIARAMVTKFGMSPIGRYQFEQESASNPYAIKQYSQKSAELIDEQINIILEDAYYKAKEILNRRSDDVHLLAKTIQEVETLGKDDIEYLIEHRELKESIIAEVYTDEEIKELTQRKIKEQQELLDAQIKAAKDAQNNNK